MGGMKVIDGDPLSADSRTRRATCMAPHVIQSIVPVKSTCDDADGSILESRRDGGTSVEVPQSTALPRDAGACHLAPNGDWLWRRHAVRLAAPEAGQTSTDIPEMDGVDYP